MNRTDYIIKRNLSKLSTSKLYNLLQMNECYDNKVVCLGFLFNEDMYYRFVESHLGAKKVIIIDNYIEQFEWIKDRFSFAKDKILFVEYSDKIKFNKMPHFDTFIMNPPYNRNFHLTILEKAIKYADNVISIQPGEFILRPYLKPAWETLKKKYKNSIGGHIKELTIVDSGDAADLFSIGIDTDLCIFVCNKTGGFDYENFYKTYDKTYLHNIAKFKTKYTIKDKLEKYDESKHKYFVPIRQDAILERWWCLQLTNYLDIIVDGKVYSGEYKGLSIYEARCKNPHENGRTNDRATYGISFNTLIEAINFRNSLQLEAYMYIIMLFKTTRKNPLDKCPIFESYTEQWTNDKIFDLFNINKTLRTTIVEQLNPFTCKTSKFGDTFTKVKKILSNLNV